MTLLERYQEIISTRMITKLGTDLQVHAALGLAGEAGEVADLYKKSQYEGNELDVPKLLLEMGDTLWYLAWLANALGYTLEELALINIEKLKEKRPHHYEDAVL
jgi:NTP pyrophosphatase (non-canonical NTP hydrolase)